MQKLSRGIKIGREAKPLGKLITVLALVLYEDVVLDVL